MIEWQSKYFNIPNMNLNNCSNSKKIIHQAFLMPSLTIYIIVLSLPSECGSRTTTRKSLIRTRPNCTGLRSRCANAWWTRCRTSATTWWSRWWSPTGTPSSRRWRRWRTWTRCWPCTRTSSTAAWRTACWPMRICRGPPPSSSKFASNSATLFRWEWVLYLCIWGMEIGSWSFKGF